MERMKRAVSLLLCVIMVFGLLPMNVFAADNSVSGEGNLPGGTKYVLDMNGVVAGATYLIVSDTAYALRNSSGSADVQSVDIENNAIASGFDYEDECTWTFTSVNNNDGWNIWNGSTYIRMGNSGVLGNSRTLGVSHQANGSYYITYTSNGTTYYLRYNNGWQRSKTSSNVYLFKREESEGTPVTFTVTPGSATIAPSGTVNLTGTAVVIGGNEQTINYDASKCTIEWKSSNDSVATVENGVVTGVADGTADITAVLSAVDGAPLEESITVTVPITVVSRSIQSYVLTGNDAVTTKKGVEPDFSNIKLTVSYDDGTTSVITIDNGLVISGYDVNEIGIHTATISYKGTEYDTVRVTVDGNPYEGLDPATKYPEYPADGAVRIDKFAKELEFETTGLVQVELDVAGVSVKSAVDVVMIMDISNSMSWDDSEYDYNDTTIDPTSNQRLNIARASAKEFVKELMSENTGNSETDNSVTVLAFAGIDGDYNTHSTAAANDDVYMLGDLAMTTETAANAALDGLVKATTGGTNYDYAFQQAYELARQVNEERGNDVYIVFMTDGVPTHYNGVYYKSRDNTDLTACMQYVDPATGTKSDYTSTGNDRNGNDIDSTATKTITVYYNDGTTATKNVTYNKGWSDYVTGNKNGWAEKVKALDYVAHVYAIGFGMKNGSVTQGATSAMPTLNNVNGGQYYIPTDVTHATLRHIATDASSHFEADNKEELSKLYKSLATQIKFAGTKANVSDVIDSDFTLQMSNTTGTEDKGIGVVNVAEKGYTPFITIKTYDLWTKNETPDAAQIGTRKGTSQDIETVTFNDNGTEAYIRTGSGTDEDPYVYSDNIMDIADDGTVIIGAEYFTYTKTPEGVETFKWNIGNITDKEIALSYYAYLKGSLEGEEANGLKYTNEKATLEYIDINGKYAQQIFPIPAVAWGGASTAYEFYLVNDDGKPCNRQGEVVPFANRIIITGPFYQDLYLNQNDEEIAQEIIAVKVLPAGYTLYDNTAKYTVQTASGENEGSLTISDPASGKEQTTILVSAVTPSYIQSRVAFGVIYNMIPDDADFILAPDQVVIDYGKSIEIDVNANNETIDEIPETVNVELIGFSKFYDNVDVTQQFKDTPYSTPFEGTYGTFSIGSNGKVLYTPHKFVDEPGKIFCVYKITNKDNEADFYYMVTELDVIPATIVYYETDFADGVFTTVLDNNADTKVSWSTNADSIEADGPQNDGTIGQNTYGFDTTYDNDAYLSNGSSLFAQGAGVDTTTATFSFTGTGFDLISRTGAAQGLIKVQVYTDANMTNAVKTVSVLNKSESDLELYQIPVVSINGLEHSTYYVKVGVDVAYTNNTGIASLNSLNRGNEFYFDAIRIYDPAKGNAMAESAYNADGEANNDIAEVRAKLLDAETYATITDVTSGMVFIDRNQTDVEIATYETIGPNNEVYLSKGQAVAFKVNTASVPASFDIGAKSITGSTAGLKVTIIKNDGTTTAWSAEKTISSSTVQFVDLLTANIERGITVTGTVDPTQFFGDGAYVVITNTGDGVLSITDLKTAFIVGVAAVNEEDPYGIATADVMDDPYAVSYTVDASTLSVARMVLAAPAAPEVPEETEPEVPETTEPEVPETTEPEVPETTEPEVPETTVPEETEPEVDTSIYNILDVSLKVSGSKKNPKYTFTVVTGKDVEDIEILLDSVELEASKITFRDSRKTGERTWTIVVKAVKADEEAAFVLTGIGEDGTRGESVTVMNNKRR